MNSKRVTDRITIEGAKMIFKNFSGEEGEYNRKGDRNFCVVIEDDSTAMRLKEDGWNIKTSKPKSEDYEPFHYLKVNVRFDKVPPTIIQIANGRKRNLTEDMVNILDWAEIKNVDLVISPYNHSNGVSAYLKALYVTMVDDDLAAKYADIPDSAADSVEFD